MSQICSLILLPSKEKDLKRKSTPIVARKTSLNSSSAYRTTMLDLPTQELPLVNIIYNTHEDDLEQVVILGLVGGHY